MFLVLNQISQVSKDVVGIAHNFPAFYNYQLLWPFLKVGQNAKIRNRYNQVPYLTHDTNGKVTNSQLDITNESQEVSPFPAGDRVGKVLDCQTTDHVSVLN